MNNFKKYIAECIGTFVLVVLGCGVAMWSGVDLVATSLAFGLVIVAMVYSIGRISGCHINPAVSLAMLIAKKISVKEFFGYIISQIIGAFIGALVVSLFTKDFAAVGANAVSGDLLQAYGNVGGLFVGLVVEIVLTFVFVLAILGVTHKDDYGKIAGVVIGCSLILVHLLGIRLTGTSVNPARSIGPAIVAMFAGEFEPIKEIWIFIVGPLAGGALAALVYLLAIKKKAGKDEVEARPEEKAE